MMLPGLVGVLTPLLVGILIGPKALGGVLVGCTATGVCMALFMSNGGGAWDNAKKYIEEGHYGGKGSDNHKAAVVGDTVGDPFKDTSGPHIEPPLFFGRMSRGVTTDSSFPKIGLLMFIH
jgi:K(+)-stimulated pyrophosphate-energized sodium pump